MRRWPQVLCALAFLALAAAARAEAPDAAGVDELMRKSGLAAQVAGAHEEIKAGAREASAGDSRNGAPALSALDMSRFEAAADKAFAPQAMHATVAAELSRRLSSGDVAELVAWLDSDLGARITREEEEASSPQEAIQDPAQARERLAKVTPARLKALERLVDAVGADQHNFEIAAQMTAAMVYAMAAVQSSDPESAAEAVRARMEARRNVMMGYYRQMALAYAARAYRDFSDAELERYIAFNRMPAAKRFNEASTHGFERALVAGCLELGRYLGREAQRDPRSS